MERYVLIQRLLASIMAMCFILQVAALDSNRGAHEPRLVYDIFTKKGYNPLIRPVRHQNDSLHIQFNLALSQIINVDEVNQLLKTNVWLQIYWCDYQLKWEPVEYGNIKEIQVKYDEIWIPDFVLFNNADGNYEVSFKSNAVVYSNSLINWIPPAIYKSSCSIDVRYYPFDEQKCEMKFGSWTHKGKALTYSFYAHMDRLDLGDYLKSGIWDIIDCPGRIDTFEDENGEKKELIVFEFVLRRKTLFYTVNLLIPCVLISFISICVFALPADQGGKITLCISVLLTQVVFLLLVSDKLPPSLTIPLIAKYLLFTFIMNLIAIVSTVIIVNRKSRTPKTHRMPNWIRVVFLKQLPKYIFMKRPGHEQKWQGNPVTPLSSYPSTPDIWREKITNIRSNEVLEMTEIHHPNCKLNTPISNHKHFYSNQSTPSCQSQNDRTISSSPQSPDSSNQFIITPELQGTLEEIKFIYQHLKAEEEYERVLEDWKYMARVLDRLCLIIFLVVTLAGTIGIFLNVPHILEFVDQDKIIQDLRDYIARAREMPDTAAGCG